MPKFNTWFPTSKHGTPALNVMDFGAIGDGLANSMNSLGFTSVANAQNGVGGNGKAYPECTNIFDSADWCALQALFKAGMTTDGVPHGSVAYDNKPMYVPAGWYITNKPLVLPATASARIFGDGSGATRIQNETSTSPNNTCITMNGLSYAVFSDISFLATGIDGIAFDMYWDGATGVTLNGCTFYKCNFSCPGGTGCYMGRGTMGSELTFINCYAQNCLYGFIVGNQNALDYVFIGGGATECTSAGIRCLGGGVTAQNLSFANNGWDMDCYMGGTHVFTTCRTESAHFIKAGGANFVILGCDSSYPGVPSVFLDCSGICHISGCHVMQGKITSDGGWGSVTIENSTFNAFYATITGVTNNGSGAFRITHIDPYPGVVTLFEDGQEVVIYNVTTPAAVNGVWVITKISSTQFDLIGSTYASGYTSGGNISPGPNNHLRGFNGRVSKAASRDLCESHVRSYSLVKAYSGTQYDNRGATAEIVFTLPSIGDNYDNKGTRFSFCVYAAQNLKIIPNAATPTTIYDGAATGTTYMQSSTVGSTVELVLMEGAGYPYETAPSAARWFVKSKTGTWTLA